MKPEPQSAGSTTSRSISIANSRRSAAPENARVTDPEGLALCAYVHVEVLLGLLGLFALLATTFASDLASLIFGETAPDSRILVGHQGKFQTCLLYTSDAADE